ncbi:WD40 repeat [Nonomuraea solani]|uniref:WD40 repeat n=1 Tax=Nonomuraea solani TaxID=1144553 RepID=A0A1H6EV52_9ACTN|nr:WD40 repeat [Nonomuraea solani]
MAQGAARLTPPALLAVLSAGALIPLALAAPGGVALAGIQVLAGVGTNVLSDVIGQAIEALRRAAQSDAETPEQAGQDGDGTLGCADQSNAGALEAEVAGRIERMLAEDGRRSEALRAEIAAVLKSVDAAEVALRVAIECGNRTLQERLAAGFTALTGQFSGFGFLLTSVERAAAEIQESLHRQDAEHRHDRERMRLQSAHLMLIREELAALRQARPEPNDGRARWERGSPYRGLLAFEADHSQVFYGRERATADLVGTLAARLCEGPVVVTGPSGVGKSSLLRAGLLPALARGLLPVPGAARWPCLVLTPTRDPLGELATQLAARSGADPVAARHSLAAEPDQAHLLVRQATLAGDGPRDGRMVIVVDQFEELFTLAGQAEAFVRALAATGPAAAVVIGVRGDFLDRCAAYPVLAEAMTGGQYVLGPMTEPELLRVITGPAAAAGLEVESGLPELVLRELDTRRGPAHLSGGYGVGALPLLSQAMLATWDNRDGDRLTIAGYGRGGGVERAVQNCADAVHDALPARQREIAPSLCRRMTVVARDGRLARRRLPRTELADADVRAVVDAFAAQRLMVVTDAGAELAHDCLLQAWPRLRGWLQEDLAGQALYGQLLDDAEEWATNARDPSFLYRGARLTAAQQLRTTRRDDTNDLPEPSVPEGLPEPGVREGSPESGACEGLPESGVLEGSLECGRTVWEFLDAGEAAAARRRRRNRTALAGLIALAVVASAAALVAVAAARTAESQEQVAETNLSKALSRQLAAQSVGFATTDAFLAARLATTAWRTWPTAEARHALVNASVSPVRGMLPGTSPAVTSVALSPDGRTVATGEFDGTVRLWDVASHRQIGSPLTGHGHSVYDITFAPRGDLLASADTVDVRLWNLTAQRQAGAPLTGHEGVPRLSFDRNAGLLAVTHDEGGKLWDLGTRKPVGWLSGSGGPPRSMAFSPTGDTMATADRTGVHLWNTATGKRTGAPVTRDRHVTALAFAPGGDTLATAAGTKARLWRVTSREPIGRPITSADDTIVALAFTGPGTLATVHSHDGTVRLWNAATGAPIGPPLRWGKKAVYDVAFGPDGRTVATADAYDKTVSLWDIAIHRQAGAPLAGHAEGVYKLAYSPDGRTLATTDAGIVRLWDVATREQLGAPLDLDGLDGYVRLVSFGADGRTLIAVGDGVARRWDVASREPAGPSITWKDGLAVLTAYSPRAGILATSDATLRTPVRLWDAVTAASLGELPMPRNAYFTSMAFSPDGRVLAVADGSDKGIHLWDLDTRMEILPSLTGHPRFVNAMAFSPDGRILASAGGDERTVRLWNVAGGTQIGAPLAGHQGPVRAVAFSPDGRTLASTGSDDRTARLWDVATGLQIGVPLMGHEGRAGAVTFSPDGRTLATAGGEDRTARLWDVGLRPDLFSVTCALASRPLDRREWGRFLPDEPYKETCPSDAGP